MSEIEKRMEARKKTEAVKSINLKYPHTKTGGIMGMEKQIP
jgi:hypothetical protein